MRTAIDSAGARMTAAAKRQDVAGIVADMADDYVSLEEPGTIRRGKSGYRAMLDTMATTGRWQDLAFDSDGLDVGGNLASDYGRWRMTVVLNKGDTVKFAGNYLHVWRRQPDGSWKLLRDISNSPLPLSPAPKPR